MTCEPNALIALAARFQGSDPKMLQMAILQLLCDAAATAVAVQADGSPTILVATTLKLGPGLTLTDEGGGVIRIDLA